MAAHSRGHGTRAGITSRVLQFPAGRCAADRDVSLDRVNEAAVRIAPYVRRTPIMQAWLPSLVGGEVTAVRLKLENLQVGW